jgi:hypothetical protein
LTPHTCSSRSAVRSASSAISSVTCKRRSCHATIFFIALEMNSTHMFLHRGMPRHASSPCTICGKMQPSSLRRRVRESGSTSTGSASSDFAGPHPVRSPAFLYSAGYLRCRPFHRILCPCGI